MRLGSPTSLDVINQLVDSCDRDERGKHLYRESLLALVRLARMEARDEFEQNLNRLCEPGESQYYH